MALCERERQSPLRRHKVVTVADSGVATPASGTAFIAGLHPEVARLRSPERLSSRAPVNRASGAGLRRGARCGSRGRALRGGVAGTAASSARPCACAAFSFSSGEIGAAWRTRRGWRRQGRQPRLVLAREQRRDLAVLEALLLILHVVVLEIRLVGRLRWSRRIFGRMKIMRLSFSVVRAAGLERQPDDRNGAEQRHPRLLSRGSNPWSGRRAPRHRHPR